MWRQCTGRHDLSIALILLLSLIAVANCDTVEQTTIQLIGSADQNTVQIIHQGQSADGTLLETDEFPNQIPIYDPAIEQSDHNLSQEMMMEDLDFSMNDKAQVSHDSEMNGIVACIEDLLMYIADQTENSGKLNQTVALLNIDYDYIQLQECLMRLARGGNDSRSNLNMHQSLKDIGLPNSTLVM